MMKTKIYIYILQLVAALTLYTACGEKEIPEPELFQTVSVSYRSPALGIDEFKPKISEDRGLIGDIIKLDIKIDAPNGIKSIQVLRNRRNTIITSNKLVWKKMKSWSDTILAENNKNFETVVYDTLKYSTKTDLTDLNLIVSYRVVTVDQKDNVRTFDFIVDTGIILPEVKLVMIPANFSPRDPMGGYPSIYKSPFNDNYVRMLISNDKDKGYKIARIELFESQDTKPSGVFYNPNLNNFEDVIVRIPFINQDANNPKSGKDYAYFAKIIDQSGAEYRQEFYVRKNPWAFSNITQIGINSAYNLKTNSLVAFDSPDADIKVLTDGTIIAGNNTRFVKIPERTSYLDDTYRDFQQTDVGQAITYFANLGGNLPNSGFAAINAQVGDFVVARVTRKIPYRFEKKNTLTNLCEFVKDSTYNVYSYSTMEVTGATGGISLKVKTDTVTRNPREKPLPCR